MDRRGRDGWGRDGGKLNKHSQKEEKRMEKTFVRRLNCQAKGLSAIEGEIEKIKIVMGSRSNRHGRKSQIDESKKTQVSG